MPVRLRPQPLVQVPDVTGQILPVLLLRDAIDPHRRILAQAVIGTFQRIWIQQMRQRVESSVRVLLRSFATFRSPGDMRAPLSALGDMFPS